MNFLEPSLDLIPTSCLNTHTHIQTHIHHIYRSHTYHTLETITSNSVTVIIMGTDYYTSLYGNLHTKLPKSISSAFRLPESNSTFAS